MSADSLLTSNLYAFSSLTWLVKGARALLQLIDKYVHKTRVKSVDIDWHVLPHQINQLEVEIV